MSIGDAVYSDFAGSGIVHMTGGIAAFMGALFLGPRIGKYDADGKPRAIPGHNIPFAILGVFILWLGWFGFNPGSELLADEFVMTIGVNTMLAAVAGGLFCTITIWLVSGKPDVAMIGNGVLAGLVAITARAVRSTRCRVPHRRPRRRPRRVLGLLLRQDQDRRPGRCHLGARRLRRLGRAVDRPVRQVRRRVPRT
jgi:hypothetical protein